MFFDVSGLEFVLGVILRSFYANGSRKMKNFANALEGLFQAFF